MPSDLESVAGFYDTESTTYESDRFLDPAGRQADRRHAQLLQEMLPRGDGKRILDIGTGTGRIARHLARDGYVVAGVDISAGMLREAHAASPTGEFIRGDAGRLPVRDACVDGFVSVNVLAHAPNFVQIIEEASRVVRPGGFLLFNYVNEHSYAYPFGKHVNRSQRGVRRNVYTRWDSPSSIKRLLLRTGFTPVRLRGQSHIPPSLPTVIRQFQGTLDRLFGPPPLSHVAQIHWIHATRSGGRLAGAHR